MARRILEYKLNLWKAIEKNKPTLKQLPPIIPLVLYQGSSPWKATQEFQGLVDSDYPELRRYMPQFEYPLVNLVELGVDAIEGDLYGKLVLHLMYAYATDTFWETLKRCGPWLAQLCRQDREGELLESLYIYILSTQDIDFDTLYHYIAQVSNTETGEHLMTLAERLEANGREEGRIEEGRTLLQTQWKLKFPDYPEIDLSPYSLKQLETIGTRLFTRNTPNAVLEGLEKNLSADAQ